jgi:hypothetical protein
MNQFCVCVCACSFACVLCVCVCVCVCFEFLCESCLAGENILLLVLLIIH